MEKKKSIKDTLKEIEYMRKASKRRQKGENVTSEDIKARMEKREMDKVREELEAQKKDAGKGGNKFSKIAMGAKDTARNFAGDGEGQGYTPATKIPSKDYSKKPTTNSADQYKPKKSKPKEEGPKKAPRRRPTGREEMIAQRYMDNEKNKKNGPVVGS